MQFQIGNIFLYDLRGEFRKILTHSQVEPKTLCKKLQLSWYKTLGRVLILVCQSVSLV